MCAVKSKSNVINRIHSAKAFLLSGHLPPLQFLQLSPPKSLPLSEWRLITCVSFVIKVISEAVCTLWFPAVFCCGVCLNWSPLPAVVPSVTRCCNTGLVSKTLVSGHANKTANCITCCQNNIFGLCISVFMDEQTNFCIFFFTFLPFTPKTMGFLKNAIKNQINLS